MKAIYVIISLVSCLLIAFAIGCSHREVYYVMQPEPKSWVGAIKLESQFGTSRGTIGDIDYFATPTDKSNPNGGKIVEREDRETHLTWYKYRPLWGPFFPTTREVTFLNQIRQDATGNPIEQKWKIGKPVYLLVPTAKNSPDDPQREESKHFLCYEVLDPKPLKKTYILNDQLNEDGEEIRIMLPLYFCAPVEKAIGASGEPLVPVDLKGEHLACYLVEVTSQEPAVAKKVTISNQFDANRDLVLRDTYMLCVPSDKIGSRLIYPPVVEP